MPDSKLLTRILSMRTDNTTLPRKYRPAHHGIVLCCVCLLIHVGSAQAQAVDLQDDSAEQKYHWQIEQIEAGCASYSSQVKDKIYIAAKTVCDLPIRLEVVAYLLRDIEGYPSWMADCQAAKILHIENPANDTLVFWLHQHVPILRDRDVILRSTVTMDHAQKHGLIEVHATRDYRYDVAENLVRMPAFYARFRLAWIDPEHTRVSFLIDPDLGNGLPVGLANATLRRIPFRSLQNMMRMANDATVISAAKNSKYARWVNEATAAQTSQQNGELE